MLKCRVCGLVHAEPPWGDDGRTPLFEMCDCCGVEFGYQDSTPLGVARYRKKWLDAGGAWDNPKTRPPDWNLAEQLAGIPAPWNDAGLAEEPGT